MAQPGKRKPSLVWQVFWEAGRRFWKMSRQECLWISQSSIPSPTRLSSIAAPPLVPTSAILTKEGGSTSMQLQKRRRNSIFRTETFNARQAVKLNNDLSYFLCPLDHYGIMKQYEIHAVLLFHMSGILFAVFLAVSFFCGISGGIFFWRYFWRYFCGISGIFTIQVRYRNDGISCFKYRIQVLH